ncbi:MAG: hypothetical protein A2261_01080 [Candidatus Magasanikbacteria bacterium RIFOXYA2_FULL_44_8]|uniref:YgjP-like metallopeptidase domain-containing protein n=1 Tax=Candidatus Magasanikbacteria bacterium RIFOXYA2_FULL_44_8 TaxID=1798696 RepID=A0A1F6NK93_9BACT|nr:MAG: hypothetical protein A2261_01080 [Candidatus Magasanikbacteria bacterium RIFOXYA2_FULL_44_8]
MLKKEEKFKVVKRKIKYPRLELKTGELVVVVPHDGDFDVPEFIRRHDSWIKDKQNLIKKFSKKKAELRKVVLKREELRELIKKCIDQYASRMTVRPKTVILKKMKSKWGSCSSGKNLCFNLLLGYLPDRIVEYVVCHELCHLKHRKHDVNFKLWLKKFYSHPEKFEALLFSYWFAIGGDQN